MDQRAKYRRRRFLDNRQHFKSLGDFLLDLRRKKIKAAAIGKLARDEVIERKHKKLFFRDHARLQRLANE